MTDSTGKISITYIGIQGLTVYSVFPKKKVVKYINGEVHKGEPGAPLQPFVPWQSFLPLHRQNLLT